jgi:hypothetical protein
MRSSNICLFCSSFVPSHPVGLERPLRKVRASLAVLWRTVIIEGGDVDLRGGLVGEVGEGEMVGGFLGEVAEDHGGGAPRVQTRWRTSSISRRPEPRMASAVTVTRVQEAHKTHYRKIVARASTAVSGRQDERSK